MSTVHTVVKMVTWNIAQREDVWRLLLDTDYDIALLQEAKAPPPNIAQRLDVDDAPWQTVGAGARRQWRTAVVKLSDRVAVQWLEPKSIEVARPGELAVSRLGTLACAVVTPQQGEPFTVASLYAVWESPHRGTGGGWIYADGSAHRLISDLSGFIGRQRGHRIIAAGDLNILHGYGENGSKYWASRYGTVFSRMAALGLSFVGPQAPAGRRADPWPLELPPNSSNGPTYHTNRQTPATATRQLDFVFASDDIAQCIQVSAQNDPDQWGPSDHCRVEIIIA